MFFLESPMSHQFAGENRRMMLSAHTVFNMKSPQEQL